MASITAAKNLYNNNIAPYNPETPIILNHLAFENLDSLDPLGKLAISDTFHDLAQPREGYDATHFNGTILQNIIAFQNKYDQPNGFYKGSLEKMFGGKIGVSHLEPSVNAFIENYFGLQPAYAEVTFDDILDHPLKFNETIKNSNGSLKITVPPEFTSFTHYLTKFMDPSKYLDAQKGISKFIKNYLFQAEDETNVDEIRFLFDAGANQIGKIFRYPGSGGIRYNAMACTADSASSSDDSLDSSRPNEYENPGPDGVIKVTSNFFSNDKYDITFQVNPKCNFGTDGTTCFSVNFSHKDVPLDWNSSARYFFGPKKNKDAEENGDPCGSEGASVSHIGKTMIILEQLRKNISGNQKQILDSVKNDPGYNSRCIPVGDSRFLKLFGKAGIQNSSQIDDIEKLLADYKRTGDYEQSLTLRRAIDKGNTKNFTFSSVDLLSTLFARLNGIPAVYQVGVNGTITLYRNNRFRGSPNAIRKEIEQARKDKNDRIAFQRNKIFTELKHIFTETEFPMLLESLENAKYTDEITKLQVDGILFVFRQVKNVYEKVSENILDEEALNNMEIIYRYIEGDDSFSSILKKDLIISDVENVQNFTLPFLDLTVRKSKSKKSGIISKLLQEQAAIDIKIKKFDSMLYPPSERDVGMQSIRTLRAAAIPEEIAKIKQSITHDTLIVVTSPSDKTIRRANSSSPSDGKKQQRLIGGTKKTSRSHKKERLTRRKSLRLKHYVQQKTLTKNIDTRRINAELLDIIYKVFNSSNAYLKDVYGRDHPSELKKNLKKTKSKTKKPRNITRKQSARNKKVFVYYTTISLSYYSKDMCMFLSSLATEFMHSLNMLIINYNYDISSLHTEQLTLQYLFNKYEILTYILVLFNSDYPLALTQTHEKTRKKIKGMMKDVQGSDGISLAMFALQGYFMKLFHANDYYASTTSFNFKPILNLLWSRNKDTFAALLDKNVYSMNQVITVFSTQGVIHGINQHRMQL